jgi:hypothetical protein
VRGDTSDALLSRLGFEVGATISSVDDFGYRSFRGRGPAVGGGMAVRLDGGGAARAAGEWWVAGGAGGRSRMRGGGRRKAVRRLEESRWEDGDGRWKM